MTAIPEKIGKYKIEELLGRGGMGEVYKAYDPTLERFVALKMMRGPALDDSSARERFIREAQAAGGLRHPNIVTVYDLGEVDGQMYIAMEFIHGDDLEKIIHNNTPLLIDDKLNVMIQVCEGIEYAHKHEIVHRDLKPSNIRIDEEGIAKIMDFGIAKLGSSTMTASGTVLGTPYYMSPEQVRGMRVDTRSDLFSLGAILYELFTYQKAFSGEMTAVFYKIAHEQPLPLSEFMDVNAEALQKIVDRCLEKDKTIRLQKAAELADMLREAQKSFRENNTATLGGIKTTGLPQGTPEFHLTPAPAVITQKKKIQTQAPAVQISGSEPTKLMTAGPTELVDQPPVEPAETPPIKVAPPLQVQTAMPPSSRTGLIIGFLLVLLAGLSAGAYFYFFHNKPAEPVIVQKPNTQSNHASGGKPPEIEKPNVKPLESGKGNVNPPAEDMGKELDTAKDFYQNGKYEEAGEIYAGLIERNPSDAHLHFLLGAAKQKMQKNQEALMEFQKAVEMDPKMAKAWQQIGYVLMNRMDYAGAEQSFQKAIDNDPNSGASWEGLAQTYLIKQEDQKAENAYKKLLEIEPENVAALYNLGRIEWARKDNDAAKDAFQKVIQLNPNYAEAHNNLGAIYLSEGKVGQCISENEKAVELKPSLYQAHYSLYLAYEQRKDYKQAAEHLRQYIDLSGDDAPELKKKLEQYGKL